MSGDLTLEAGWGRRRSLLEGQLGDKTNPENPVSCAPVNKIITIQNNSSLGAGCIKGDNGEVVPTTMKYNCPVLLEGLGEMMEEVVDIQTMSSSPREPPREELPKETSFQKQSETRFPLPRVVLRGRRRERGGEEGVNILQNNFPNLPNLSYGGDTTYRIPSVLVRLRLV